MRDSSYRQRDAQAELLKQVLPCEHAEAAINVKTTISNVPSLLLTHWCLPRDVLLSPPEFFPTSSTASVPQAHIYPAEPWCVLGLPLATPDFAPIGCGPQVKPCCCSGPPFLTGRTQRVGRASCQPGSYVVRVKEIPNEITSVMGRKCLKKKGGG